MSYNGQGVISVLSLIPGCYTSCRREKEEAACSEIGDGNEEGRRLLRKQGRGTDECRAGI